MTLPQNLIQDIVFQKSPLGIAVIDSITGVIYQTNESYCSILGRNKIDILGNDWMSFTHPDDILNDLCCISKLREEKSEQIYREKRYLRPDGTIVYVGITLSILQTGCNTPLHITMVQDLTPSMQMRTQLIDRTKEVYKARESVFNSLAVLSEFRDRETGEHILRTKTYVKLLLENLPFSHPYSKKAINLISNSAMLHDIGKVGIPDSILLKPGKLTAAEFEIMKTHTTLGTRAIQHTRHNLGNDTIFMFAQEIAEFHHEKWDGTGYPLGLTGDQIPLTARIMALADVYDALISERPYKLPFSHAEAVAIIRKESGSHFDPVLVDLFLKLEKEFECIALSEKEELKKRLSAEDDWGFL